MADEEMTTVELGGNISLSGFRDLEPGSMTIVKKLVGTYTRKYTEKNPNFGSINLHLKEVHKTEKGEIYEVHGKILMKSGSNNLFAEHSDRNLFVVVDTVLKKLDEQIEKVS